MFHKIETAILTVLQEGLKTVPREKIGLKIPEFTAEDLPAITLANLDFEIKEVGIGRSIGEEALDCRETLSGDGKAKEFALTQRPTGQLILEHPPGNRLQEDEDFTVDVERGILTFKRIPRKGAHNIIVDYQPSAGSVRGLTFNLRYHLTVWAADDLQRDSIAINVIELLLREEEALNQQEIYLALQRGFSLPECGSFGSSELPSGVYGKTLEYAVTSTLQIATPIPRIKKIEIKLK